MKTKLTVFAIFLFVLPFISSCSDKKNSIIDEPEENPIDEDFDITEVTKSNLSPGQTAEFSLNDDGSYTLTLKGTEFDLSSVENNPCGGIVEVPGPVLGMRECSFPVSVVKKEDKNGYTFSGTFKNDAIEFIAEGTIQKEQIKFNNSTIVEQAFMPDAPKIGDYFYYYTWLTERSGYTDDIAEASTFPFLYEWETSENPFGEGYKTTMSDVLQAILDAPFLSLKDYGFEKANPDIVSPATLYSSFVTGISIKSYGKTHATAISLSLANASSETMAEGGTFYLPSFLFHRDTFIILPVSNSKIRLFINPGYLFDIKFDYADYTGSVFNDASYTIPVNTPATFSVLSNIISALSPDNANGLEMDYSYSLSADTEKGNLAFTFADTTTALKFLKAFLLPLIENDANKTSLADELSRNPLFKDADIDVASFIEGLPKLLDSTTKLKFGFNSYHLPATETDKVLGSVRSRL